MQLWNMKKTDIFCQMDVFHKHPIQQPLGALFCSQNE